MRIILLVVFLNLQALANVEKSQVSIQNTTIEKNSNSSAENRVDKRFSINAKLFGIAFMTRATSLELSYFIDDLSLVSLEVMALSGDVNNGELSDDFKGSAVKLNFKKFLSNSFYINPGLYYRSQEFITLKSMNSNGDYNYAKEEHNDVGFDFRIGNQWQWDNFTMGCDWVGINSPIYTLNDVKRFRNDRNSSLSVLNFYVGMAF